MTDAEFLRELADDMDENQYLRHKEDDAKRLREIAAALSLPAPQGTRIGLWQVQGYTATPPAAPSQGEPSPQTPAETEIIAQIDHALERWYDSKHITTPHVGQLLRGARDKIENLQAAIAILCRDDMKSQDALRAYEARIADLERAAVPREPTEAMVKAGHDYGVGTSVVEIWRAMWDAAQPPSGPTACAMCDTPAECAAEQQCARVQSARQRLSPSAPAEKERG